MSQSDDKFEELTAATKQAAEILFAQFGPESAVVVMVGIPEGDTHSAFRVVTRGRCLSVEGLLVRCAQEVQDTLWEGKVSPK